MSRAQYTFSPTATPTGGAEHVLLRASPVAARPELRLGIIGMGRWGGNLLRVFSAVESARVVAVCDLDEARLAQIPEPMRRETSSKALLRRDDISAVVIATPPETQTALVLQALRAGKDVFVEKPMAMSLEDALRVRVGADASGRRVMVGFVLYHHPAVRELRRLVAGGALGEVVGYFSRRGGVRRSLTMEAAWWSLAPHDVSLACTLFAARATRVSATSSGDHLVMGRIEFEDGRSASLVVDGGLSARVRRVVVPGSSATAVFDDLDPAHKLKLFAQRGESAPSLTSIERALSVLVPDVPEVGDDEPLQLEAAHFVDCVTGATPVTNLEHAIEVVAVLAAGHESWRLRGAPVAVAEWKRAR